MPKPIKRPAVKPSIRDTLKANENAMNYWADAFGKPRVDYGIAEKQTRRRAADPRRSVNGGLLESAVQSQIIEYLRVHPRVKWFARINSCAAVGAGGGHVTFYRLYMKGLKPRTDGITDIIGQTDNGCLFVIECKREGVFKATDEQNEFMGCVVGVRGVAQSLGDAETIVGNALTFSR